MNLYRLDHVAPDGSSRGAVSDMLGPVLIRNYADARQLALDTARSDGSVIAITRISGAGAMRVMAHASGETGRVHRVKR